MTTIDIGNARIQDPGSRRGVKQVYDDQPLTPLNYVRMMNDVLQQFAGPDAVPPMSYHIGRCHRRDYGLTVEFDPKIWSVRHIMDAISRRDNASRMQLWQNGVIGIAFPMPSTYYDRIVGEIRSNDFRTKYNRAQHYYLDGEANINLIDCNDYIDFVAVLRPYKEKELNLKTDLVMVGVNPERRIDRRQLRNEMAGEGKMGLDYVIDSSLVPDPYIMVIDAHKVKWAEDLDDIFGEDDPCAVRQ